MSEDRLLIDNHDQFRKKADRRRELAELPIEEKLKRLVKLQHIAYSVGKQAGRPTKAPWGSRGKRQA